MHVKAGLASEERNGKEALCDTIYIALRRFMLIVLLCEAHLNQGKR